MYVVFVGILPQCFVNVNPFHFEIEQCDRYLMKAWMRSCNLNYVFELGDPSDLLKAQTLFSRWVAPGGAELYTLDVPGNSQ